MQTRPFLITPACIFECSRNRGGGFEHRKINLPQKYQIIYFHFFCFLSLASFPHPYCLLFANSHCASEPQCASVYVVSSPMLPPTPQRKIVRGRAGRISPRTTRRCGICCRKRRIGSVEDWSSLHLRWSRRRSKWKIYSYTFLQEQSLHHTLLPPCIPGPLW